MLNSKSKAQYRFCIWTDLGKQTKGINILGANRKHSKVAAFDVFEDEGQYFKGQMNIKWRVSL
jgi:hypothetical protein